MRQRIIGVGPDRPSVPGHCLFVRAQMNLGGRDKTQPNKSKSVTRTKPQRLVNVGLGFVGTANQDFGVSEMPPGPIPNCDLEIKPVRRRLSPTAGGWYWPAPYPRSNGRWRCAGSGSGLCSSPSRPTPALQLCPPPETYFQHWRLHMRRRKPHPSRGVDYQRGLEKIACLHQKVSRHAAVQDCPSAEIEVHCVGLTARSA